MASATRLGYFFLVLAFLLYLVSEQVEAADPELQGRLIVFRVLFGLLGFLLVTRYRAKAQESSRFSWIRNFLFKRGNKRGKKTGPRRRDRNRDKDREISFDEFKKR
jgi:hypothetical protein